MTDFYEDILALSTPGYRRGYSDRTAWLMACLSRLAYRRFNPIMTDDQRRVLNDRVDRLLDRPRQKELIELVESLGYDPDAERAELERELAELNGTLLDTVDDGKGTQAILVRLELGVVLAFRGTEATSVRDIKSDADARSVRISDGARERLHQGFWTDYQSVQPLLDETLAPYRDEPLFITGHSLGGALATITARQLNHPGGIAACYTFGAPRVGNEHWVATMKAPLYRVVNAADCVTMLPPGAGFIDVLGWLVRWIPGVGLTLRRWLQSQFGGYMHAGDMRYLKNVPAGAYDETELLYAVSFFYRVKAWLIKKLPWKRFLADHAIEVYRLKLAAVARKRNGAG